MMILSIILMDSHTCICAELNMDVTFYPPRTCSFQLPSVSGILKDEEKQLLQYNNIVRDREIWD